VAELRAMGRLEPVDEARVVAFLELASTVDEVNINTPGAAGLWRMYRDAERTLRESDDSDDALADLFAALRDGEDA
jgi:hypothetical protein